MTKAKDLSAAKLAKRLPSGEGIAGLTEWCADLRAALLASEPPAPIGVAGLGQWRVLPKPRGPEIACRSSWEFDGDVGRWDYGETDVDEVVAAMTGAIDEGYTSIVLPDFGTLRLVTREAFSGLNPRTGAPVAVGVDRLVEFVPDKALASALRRA